MSRHVNDILSREGGNNFNLLRLILALGVLYNHSFVLFDPRGQEDLMGLVFRHFDSGSLSVCIFFLISGLLLTQSFHQTRVKLKWVLRRLLRIFPGLIVNLMFTALIVGTLSTALGAKAHLLSRDTWRFFYDAMLNNEYFIFNIPGCFPGNRVPEIMNGSLWTLPFELTCYIFLFILLNKLDFLRSERFTLFGKIVLLALVVFFLAYLFNARILVDRARGLVTGFNPRNLVDGNNPLKLFLFFFTGAAVYGLRRRIPLDFRILAVVLALAVGARFSGVPLLEKTTEYLVLVYGALFFAGLPGLFRYNSSLDPSYGVYLYAWPLQQLVASWWDLGAYASMAVTIPLVLVAGILSYILIERPCMRSMDTLYAFMTVRDRS